MQKNFKVDVSSSVIPDGAITEHDVQEAISQLVYRVERQYGMGSVYVHVEDYTRERRLRQEFDGYRDDLGY